MRQKFNKSARKKRKHKKSPLAMTKKEGGGFILFIRKRRILRPGVEGRQPVAGKNLLQARRKKALRPNHINSGQGEKDDGPKRLRKGGGHCGRRTSK